MKISLSLIAAIISLSALTGCNTIHGAGEDIAKGGEAIQKVAK